MGCLREDYEVVYEHGIDAVFPIIRQLGDLSEILNKDVRIFTSSAQNIARLLALKDAF